MGSFAAIRVTDRLSWASIFSFIHREMASFPTENFTVSRVYAVGIIDGAHHTPFSSDITLHYTAIRYYTSY
jgi:hypothetical protein